MPDYTYRELMKMQNDAIRRAEDMQMRARKSAGLEENAEETKNSASPEEPKHIKMPGGYLVGNQQKEEIREKAPETQNDFLEKFKSGLGDINIDSDKALLLSLIMLLSEEKADELLIMALIYMLS